MFKKMIVFIAFSFFLLITIFKEFNELISNSFFELMKRVIKKAFYMNKIFLKNLDNVIKKKQC